MRILRFLAALVAVICLQLFGSWLYPSFPRAFDLFLVLTVLCALRGNSAIGLLAGMAAGLSADALSAGPYGLFGFTNTLIGYTTARVSQRLVIQRASQYFLVTAAAIVVQQLLLTALASLLFDHGRLPDLAWLPIKAITGGFIAFLTIVLRATLYRGRERRRRGRLERLRL